MLSRMTTMLRITPLTTLDPGGLSLKLEGQVAGPWVRTLRQAHDEHVKLLSAVDAAASPRLALDLADVSFIDSNGVALLRALVAEGVELKNRSAYVAELLREVAHGND